MPRSRKRHHSRSRSKSRSRSPSRERNQDKQKNPSSHEKDGKRRRLDELLDSPPQKSLSSDDGQLTNNERLTDKEASEPMIVDLEDGAAKPTDDVASIRIEVIYDKNEKCTTPTKPLTPRQLQKKIESEKKKQQRHKEKEEREKQLRDEKAKILAEKQKIKEQKEAERLKALEEKQKQLEQKQKEKELKEEQKKKEREEKEQKRKEKEEQEAQKRKEKEQEKLKKLQEIEEKNKEKLREEEKKRKSAALFKNFFKKTEGEEKEPKIEKTNSNFMPFEVKSDMRLPPLRRKPLSANDIKSIDHFLSKQDDNISYIKQLKSGEICPGKSFKTWPYQDPEEDLVIIEEDKSLGEQICEDKTISKKMKAKFLFFHENRRPAYFGTWRKKSAHIKARRPLVQDTHHFNYDEDSDDDWEDEEQGESLDVSGDEEEKEVENDEDDYEVDNELFVPHGHLSDDEIDDAIDSRLSPDAMKQKLKLLRDEFEEDMKLKTHKLKPRFVGCVWMNKENKIDEALYRYLLPFAMIVDGPKEIKKRSEIFNSPLEKRKTKTGTELPIDHIPLFLKIIHGNVHNNKVVVKEFLTFMAEKGHQVDVSKAYLTRFLKQSACYRKSNKPGSSKNKFGWFVNDEVIQKYNVNLDIGN